ncbi:MAG: pyridoxal phosphate-dependent aminotransferase [Cyclobacteriaceae bacterium]|nr:pyridoxal phosphate-dependent aminotransferase [Cyclobacteriaceae bacterium]
MNSTIASPQPVSQRISSLAESATLAMAAKAREYRAKGIDVIALSLGEPDFKTPTHICEGAKKAIDEGSYFSYPPVNGYLDLRQAICNKLSRDNHINYTPDQIVVSNGAKQSIANTMFSLVNPGDEVIVFSPFWVSYEAIIQLAEGKPVFIEGTIENQFKATAAQLKAAITPKTKAVIYSSPSNPTGGVFNREEMQAIANVLADHPQVYVIADEIYEFINYTGEHVSLASFPEMYDRTITVNGFAKGFAMTGWRVGYIAAPQWIAKACSKMQGQITSANCSIAQRAALTALTEDLGPTHAMAEEYLRRRDLVYELLQEIPGIKTNLPEGAFYFFPDISAYFGKTDGQTTISNSDDFCMYLLDEAHVALVTGSAFGAPNCVRLSYAASEENLRKAIAKIKEVLSKLA